MSSYDWRRDLVETARCLGALDDLAHRLGDPAASSIVGLAWAASWRATPAVRGARRRTPRDVGGAPDHNLVRWRRPMAAASGLDAI
jgi:hypothetical protein